MNDLTCHRCGYPLGEDQVLCPECGQSKEKSVAAWKSDGAGPTADGHSLDHAMGAWVVGGFLAVVVLGIDVFVCGTNWRQWLRPAPLINVLVLLVSGLACRSFVVASLEHTPYVWPRWKQALAILGGWASLVIAVMGLMHRK